MMMQIIGVCPFCGETHDVFADEMGVLAWKNGELIQNALPTLTPTEREQMISGICPDCQKKIFGEDTALSEDEDEDEDSPFHLVYEDDDDFLAEVDADLSDEDFMDLIESL